MITYWKDREEKEINEAFGKYRLNIRYFANSNKAQVSISDVSLFRFPLLWSETLTDEQAESALNIFKSVGYFDLV